MSDGIKISVNNLPQVKQQLAGLEPIIEAKISKFLDKHTLAIVTKAKQRVPKDEGTTANAISGDLSKPLEKHVTVNVPWAAFLEFGTGKYAAAYVGTLPADWQTYAAQFKGQKGAGNFEEMVRRIAEWIGRKSIYADTALHGTFSVKTQKRTGKKAANKEADLGLAYVIARSIMINGIHAHPYLYPAYAEQMVIIIRELPNILKAA